MMTHRGRIRHLRWAAIGLLLAVLAGALPLASSAAAVPPAPALAAPTGPHPVSTTDLHLVDEARVDPWVPGEQRRLMVTVWYPARPGPAGTQAPYVGPGLAAELDATATPALGLATGVLDWARIPSHAVTGVPAAGGPGERPMLLYSPGAFESRLFGTGLAVDLASHGYVVVAVDHTYEATVDFPDGVRARQVPAGLKGAAASEQLRRMFEVRVADTRFVLDAAAVLASGGNPDVDGRALPSGLARSLDLSRVGLLGHSAGGDAAVQTMAQDPRVDAAADLDGFLAYDSQGDHPLPAAEHGVDRPVLLMGSQSMAPFPPPGEPVAWELRSHRSNPAWAALWQRSTGPIYDIGVTMGRHHVFTDHRALLPDMLPLDARPDVVAGFVGTGPDPDRAGRSVHAHVRAFFDQELRGCPQPLLRGPSPEHPDLTFVR